MQEQRRISRLGSVLIATLVALIAVLGLGEGTGVLVRTEQQSVDARFQLRGAHPTDDIVVIGVDEDTLSAKGATWPLSRRLHARMIDVLTKAGALQVVYDVQFTEPSRDAGADLALFEAAERNGRMIFATGESDGHGRTHVLGGDDNLRSIGAVAAASNFPTDATGVIRHYERAVAGLPTVATRTATQLGVHPSSSEEPWIDFRGPPGTIPTYSFAKVLDGSVPASALRGKVVVVGGTAPVLQDVHPTAASGGQLMSGPELQANAILTAMDRDPVRSAPNWTGWLAVVLLALAGPLAAVLLGPVAAVIAAPLVGGAYVVGAQLAFGRGFVLDVAAPLAGLCLGTVFGVVVAAMGEGARRRRAVRRNAELEEAVRERTADLAAAQLEMAVRLARAAELRDDDTGEHIDRMSRLCEAVGLEAGMSVPEAELLRHASVLHDVGKIGLPDGILRKPGRLTDDELAVMRRHAADGAAILEGSTSEVLRLAEVVARTHHERWDGSGYPAGLSGEDIPLPGRIAAVSDVFDALTSARPYKAAWSLEEACEEIERQRGAHFDPAVADALLRVVRRQAAEPPFVASVAPPSVDARPERDVAVGTQQDDAALRV